jgi:hypothetical protein
LIKDNPIQTRFAEKLKRLIDLKIASRKLLLREQAGLCSNRNYFNTERQRIMDDIRKVSYNMDQLEENSLIVKLPLTAISLLNFYVVLGGIISILPLF